MRTEEEISDRAIVTTDEPVNECLADTHIKQSIIYQFIEIRPTYGSVVVRIL